MKKLNIIIFILLSVIGFTSCEDDKDPVINSAALDGTLAFHLNQTRYINSAYVLEDTNADMNMDLLTCVQPNYGFTAAVTYTTQVCTDSIFAEDTYVNLATTVTGEKVGVNTKEMNKAIIQLFGKLPNPIIEKNVYVRLKAFITDAMSTTFDSVTTVKPLYSNSIKLKILPYEFPLFPFNEITPVPYFIVGLGDGNWNNSNAGIGSSLIPLNVTSGKKYDLNGNGEFVYTGYFEAARGFKLIRDIGGWSEQWGMTDGVLTHNTGGNINVPTDGFYTITLNSIDNTMTIEAAAISPASYSKIGLIGAFNGWSGDAFLSPTETSNNHVWYTTYTFTADSELKFRADEDWKDNWGIGEFPNGIGINNGANIPAKAGKYVIILNDIDGSFTFIKL